jgi:hypothetical protein
MLKTTVINTLSLAGFHFGLLAGRPERKVVFPFAATFTNNSLNQYVGIATPDS